MRGTAPQPTVQHTRNSSGRTRPGLSCLLHALNQPLTGLQCSLELAAARQRSANEYLGTIREALTLTERLRILVEALREAIELRTQKQAQTTGIPTDELIRETVEQLRPVAEARRLLTQENYSASATVALEREFLESQLFRLLESAMNLTEDGGRFDISTDKVQDEVRISVSWDSLRDSERSSGSRADLALIVCQALFEQAGAEWEQDRAGNVRRCTIRMPLFEHRRP